MYIVQSAILEKNSCTDYCTTDKTRDSESSERGGEKMEEEGGEGEYIELGIEQPPGTPPPPQLCHPDIEHRQQPREQWNLPGDVFPPAVPARPLFPIIWNIQQLAHVM